MPSKMLTQFLYELMRSYNLKIWDWNEEACLTIALWFLFFMLFWFVYSDFFFQRFCFLYVPSVSTKYISNIIPTVKIVDKFFHSFYLESCVTPMEVLPFLELEFFIENIALLCLRSLLDQFHSNPPKSKNFIL